MTVASQHEMTVARQHFTQTSIDADVLIQDPDRNCAYLIPASKLESFRAGPDAWSRVGPGTVTFVVPREQYVTEVPPFIQSPDGRPSVLIQDPGTESAYFLDFEKLQEFRVEQPMVKDEGYGVSFVIPTGTELIEELPPGMRALLQSGEWAPKIQR